MKNKIQLLTLAILLIAAAGWPYQGVWGEGLVDLVLVSNTESCAVGDTFDVDIEVRSGTQEVVGVDVFLDFDPAKLAVVDMDTAKSGVQITERAAFSTLLQNLTDNSAGQIAYSAGSFKPYPGGTFIAATVRFKALAVTETTTAVTFSTSEERPTLVIGVDQSTFITGELKGARFSLVKVKSSGSSGGGGSGTTYITPATSGLIPWQALKLNQQGVTPSAARLGTTDGKARLDIAAGTTILDEGGRPLEVISAAAPDLLPAAPAGSVIILIYDLGPAGSTFKPAIGLSFLLTMVNLPENVKAEDLCIAVYDGTDWSELTVSPDVENGVISAGITHFSSFALLGRKTAATTPASTAAAATPTVAATTQLPVVTNPPATPPPVITTSPASPVVEPGETNVGEIGSTVVTTAATTIPADPSTQPATSPVPTRKDAVIQLIAALILLLGVAIMIIRNRKKKPENPDNTRF